MAVGLEMLAGTPRPCGREPGNQAEKRKHRTEVIGGHREGMAVGLEMLAGTPRPVGENQAKKREHRTEVTEATEREWPLGWKCSRGHRGLWARTRRKRESIAQRSQRSQRGNGRWAGNARGDTEACGREPGERDTQV